MAWNVLAGVPLAATFFLIDERADAGPILAQVDVPAGEDDDLAARYRRVYTAIPAAVEIVCAGLRRGALALAPQDEAAATWLGARRPDDGVIDWTAPAAEIARLVTASAAPHPGAFTFQRDTRLRIERCAVAPAGRFTGVPGRIVAVGPGEQFVVATADGAVVVAAWRAGEPWAPAIGMLLGYHPQLELARLRARVRALEEALAALLAERKTEGQP
jgi:methionyl-tRNA formyltransferase